MKICKKCGEVNKDNSPVCKNVNCSSNEFEAYDEIKKKSLNNLKKNIFLSKFLNIFFLVVATLILIILFIINYLNSKLTWFVFFKYSFLMLVSILCINYSSKIFFITHIFSIKDVDENQMSDMYETFIKICGVIIYFYSIICLFLNIK